MSLRKSVVAALLVVFVGMFVAIYLRMTPEETPIAFLPSLASPAERSASSPGETTQPQGNQSASSASSESHYLIDALLGGRIEEASLGVQRLLEAPPPKDIRPLIEPTDGPREQHPVHGNTPGLSLVYRSYMVTPTDGADMRFLEWIDLGETESVVQSVNDDGSAVLRCVTQKPLTASMSFLNYDKEKTVQFSTSETQVTKGKNGEIRQRSDVRVATSHGDVGVSVSGASNGSLIFPGGSVTTGSTWTTGDESAPQGTFSTYTFSGYAMVDGVRCMTIVERSKTRASVDLQANTGSKLNVQVNIDTEGVHYFDPERQVQVYKDVIVKRTGIASDNASLTEKIESLSPQQIYRTQSYLKSYSVRADG